MDRQNTTFGKRARGRINMSNLRSADNPPIAIIYGDQHASLRVPNCRAETPEQWLEIQGEYLDQVGDLAEYLRVPIIHTGDVFDKWDSEPELINFLIDRMPKCYGIPGQHDLPSHSYADKKRSAYWTLVEAGTIIDMPPKRVFSLQGTDWFIEGFPWGTEPRPRTGAISGNVLAVMHHHCWHERMPFAVNSSDVIFNITMLLAGYRAVAIGDNHNGACVNMTPGANEQMRAFLNGSFMRRKSDEINRNPWVGILQQNGDIWPRRLDAQYDKFRTPDSKIETATGVDATELLSLLQRAGDAVVTYREAVAVEMKRIFKRDKIASGIDKMVLDELEAILREIK